MKNIVEYINESSEFKFSKTDKVGNMINSFRYDCYTTYPDKLNLMFDEDSVKDMSKKMSDNPEDYSDIWGVHFDEYYCDDKHNNVCWNDFCKYVYPCLDICLQHANGKTLEEFCKALEYTVRTYLNPSFIFTCTKDRTNMNKIIPSIVLSYSNSVKETNIKIYITFKK